MSTEEILKANYAYALGMKKELIKMHPGKYLLIHDRQLVDAYDAYETAAREGVRLFGTESGFLVFHAVDKEPVNIVYEAAF